jgi:hypothetical protein
MNGVISISVLIIFIIVFSSFFFLNTVFPVDNSGMIKNSFFSMNTNLEENLVFLLGSSMVAHQNVTKIDEMVSRHNDSFTVFNVAYNGDTPKKRILYIDELVSLKPKIIFYGISYDTFVLSYEEIVMKNSVEMILPDPKSKFEELINENNEKFGPFNPKITSLQIIRDGLSFTGLFPPTNANKIYLPNAPFSYFAEYQREIHTDSQNLERYTTIDEIKETKILSKNNERVDKFKKIIKKFQENDIRVVILLAPLHETFLSNIPKTEHDKFYRIVDEIKNEFNLQVYDFQNRYENLPIWMDVTHVAYHKNSMIYSEDVAEKIILEINKLN